MVTIAKESKSPAPSTTDEENPETTPFINNDQQQQKGPMDVQAPPEKPSSGIGESPPLLALHALHSLGNNDRR